MPGRASDSKALQFLGAAVFIVAVVGYVAFGWRFGESNGPIPLALGVLFAAIAIGWTVYERVSA